MILKSEIWATAGTTGTLDKKYLRSRETEYREPVRAYLDELWQRYEPFCGDRDFIERLQRREFDALVWQMYVGVCLLDAGLVLSPGKPHGPDHQIVRPGGGLINVECVIATPGTKVDIPKRTYGSAPKSDGTYSGLYRPPPDDAIALRLTSVIRDKVAQHARWIQDGIVRAEDPFVIAIGSSGIPDVDLEEPTPRIVDILYGLGPITFSYALYSDAAPEVSRQPKPQIAKTGAAPVSARSFLDGEQPQVSAVLFSSNPPEWPPEPPRGKGRDLILVHNATANAPLPRGIVPLGREFWNDAAASQLVLTTHRPELPEVEPPQRLLDELEAYEAKHGDNE